MGRSVWKVIIVSVFLLFPVIAHAETKAGTYELSPFAGFYDMHKADLFGGGIRLGYNLTGNWEVEGAYDRAGSKGDIFHFDALYNFTPYGPVTPFVLAGTGVAHISPESYNSILGEIGAGIKYAINDVVGFRADVRDMQEKYNDVVATAGLTFTFGGEKQAKVEYVPTPVPKPKPEVKPVPKVVAKPAPKPEVKIAPTPKVEAQPKVEKRIEKERIELKILFAFDKWDIRPKYLSEIKKVADILKKNPDVTAKIRGYTDSRGSQKYNLKLSERRANSVKQALVRKFGIGASRLTAKGYGESNPVASNRTSQGRRENRRTIVIFYVEKK